VGHNEYGAQNNPEIITHYDLSATPNYKVKWPQQQLILKMEEIYLGWSMNIEVAYTPMCP
jgi:hypothetical protein